MFFLALLLLFLWFILRGSGMPLHATLFMVGIFAGLGYIAGFLDSRYFKKLDAKRENQLAEVERRYAERYNAPEILEDSSL